ncbi:MULTISPECIES: carbohydrate ABC transporter permease [unclassified Paenibacillus]|jgi:putative aldouronate transport system permease protein|uniref:carbohydrate ABC transporter permease n=1 Tax=unclassified Paenibacillus TaxID=185978 RepID=UPI002783BFF7|nr:MULTISPECIES: carbohydrate ABC transporter permease [unclassified Paenibacillus]MDF2645960.1 sugar transporter permease [Paenibacillus sp.]MDQ0897866.1 putative aldouronate transport system permease protein [Paenibacillus sp. V4I7]MDQ0916138.1 putative aldouronate transport system permease protein [Paenibacillus sp. V4I5]
MRTKSSGDIVFAWFVYVFLLLVFIATFYPFWNILVLSLNSAEDTIRGGVYFWPRVFSLTSYKQILGDQEIINGVKVTLARTLIGTPLAVLVISLLSYPLSKRDLVGGKFITLFFIFTMYFGGGLIPYYMILKSLHLIDTFWVYIAPGLMNVFFMILVRTFIQQLPGELDESAKIDGANDLQIFVKIVLPLTTPVLATIGLFVAIGHWNSWFDSYVFTYKPELKTLQAVLVKILNQYQTSSMVSDAQQMADSAKRLAVSSDSIRMAATIVATVPIVIVYPFLQKYFVKGMTVGAVKA